MNSDPVVIVAAHRTPIGALQGSLAPVTATELSAVTNRACMTTTGLAGEDVDEAIIGCVLQAGLGQSPARQAVLAAGLPYSVHTMTINKVCGSGMKSVMIGNNLVRTGSAAIVLAGGMESMSNAPYLLPKARKGYHLGHKEVLDHMFYDGLQNPYDEQMMGVFGEATAKKYGYTREQQDEFAAVSVMRARAAQENGSFDAEIVPVTVTTRHKDKIILIDDEPERCDVGAIPNLRPAFAKGGTVTAASSSSISDGAASVIVMSPNNAAERGIEPLAKVIGHASHAHEPEWFTTAPTHAIRKLLDSVGWTVDDVDLFEINEAFACVTMLTMEELNIDHTKVNVNGGACALGHPIGASGTRLIVTLVHALRNRGLTRGVASLCIGGGEAVAVAIEI